MKYNGVECRRAKIRNGEYDFFSTQWIYWDTNVLDASEEALVADLMTFAKQPGNLPSRKADYWASLAEMNVAKGSDYSYPAWQVDRPITSGPERSITPGGQVESRARPR